MECPYCKEGIKEGASVCPHCRKDQPKERNRKSSRAGWIMFWIVSAILGIFGLMGTIGANIPQKDRATQIKEACERQFGVGTSQTADCQLAIITKTIRDQRNEKMGQALRDSGG